MNREIKNDRVNYFWIISPFVFQNAIWPITRILMAFFGRLNIQGLENVRAIKIKKRLIFVSNHSSELDPFLTPVSLPFLSSVFPLFYTTRERSFYNESGIRQIFYGGLLFKLFGGHQVYSGFKDYDQALVNHLNLLRKGHNLMVFPEGGITKTGTIVEARGGVAYLAEMADALVIPVGISGVFRITPADFLMRKRKIKIVFGHPIDQTEIKKNVIHEETERDISLYRREAKYIMKIVSDLIK